MDVITYAFALGMIFLFDILASAKGRGFLSLIGMFITIFTTQQLYSDGSLTIAWFSAGNSQTTNMNVYLFILLMALMFSGLQTLWLRKTIKKGF